MEMTRNIWDIDEVQFESVDVSGKSRGLGEAEKRNLWQNLNLAMILPDFEGPKYIFGDFNAVCKKEERRGSLFNRRVAEDFKVFFTESELFDLPIGGRKFTWMNKSGSKLSKLDRSWFHKSFFKLGQRSL